MAKMRVSGWNGVDEMEISDKMAEAIGGEPHFFIGPMNGYLCGEVRNREQLVASSTFSTADFPANLAEADKPRYIFLWLFPSHRCFTPS